MDIFQILFYQPVYNLLIVFYRLFGENLGIAIILVALITRFVTFSFTLRQSRNMVKNLEMNDRMQEVKEKYKDNKEKQNEEMMKLNSEYMPALIGGCLPLIIQLVMFININHVITDILTKGVNSFNNVAYSINGTQIVPRFADDYIFNTGFLGGILDLIKAPKDFEILTVVAIPYIIIILFTGIFQYFSAKLSFDASSDLKKRREELLSKHDPKYAKKKKKKEQKEKENPATEDFSKIMQQSTKQTLVLLPILLIFGGYSLPIGMSLYWFTQSGVSILQQLYANRVNMRNLEKEFPQGESL